MRRMALALPDRLVVVERDNTCTVPLRRPAPGHSLVPRRLGRWSARDDPKSGIGAEKLCTGGWRGSGVRALTCVAAARAVRGEVSGVTARTSNVVRGSALGTALDGPRAARIDQ